MIKFADLHIHTNYSDSTASPEEVVKDAVDCGLYCIAITDHDTLEGVKPTQLIAAKYDLEVLSGVELSTEIEGKDMHILGYLFDCEEGPLAEILKEARHARVNRIHEMIRKLKGLGVDNIESKEVCDLAQTDAVGRPHLAAVLKRKGWVSTISQAFHKYLAEGRPAYVPKYKLTPFEAIKLIRESGGISVMAHPMVTCKDELIPQMVEAGLQGIEVSYPNFAGAVREYYEGIAEKHNLVMTGGSDAHGKSKDNTYIGKAKVPYEYVERLKELKS